MEDAENLTRDLKAAETELKSQQTANAAERKISTRSPRRSSARLPTPPPPHRGRERAVAGGG